MILINIAFIFIYKILLDNFYAGKAERNRNHLSALLGLNISHLHDAANFFALIKSQTQDSKLQDFAKGASFHFRSLFEELSHGKKVFDETAFEDIGEDYLGMLYHKEAIDLKDILELELLQLSASSENRLNIINESNSEHALIYGNFSLLSKAILNLIENALKYTTQPIKLELQDTGNSWQIKVSSYGESISESLANAINSQASDSNSVGHGLSSLNQIMLFHNADLSVDTLAHEGTSIRLIFKKYQATVNLAKTVKRNSAARQTREKQIILVILTGVLCLCLYAVYYNRITCQAYYRSFTKVDSSDIIQKERKCLQYLEEINEVLVDDISDELYLRYGANTKEELLDELYHDFLKQFSGKNRDLVSLIVFDQFLLRAPIDYEALIDKEAKLLIVKFPSAPNLNLFLGNHYFEKKKYGKATIYSIKALTAFIESKLYLHPRLYLVSKLEKDNDNLSQFLATLYDETKLNEKPLEKPVEKPLEKPLGKPLKTTTPSPEIKKPQVPIVKPNLENGAASTKPSEAVDELIDKQDKELGLDLDL